MNDIVMDTLISEFSRMESNIIKGVLTQILNREPLPEDAKTLTKIYYEGEKLNYDLAYLNVKIGRVVFDMCPPPSFEWTIKFIPTSI